MSKGSQSLTISPEKKERRRIMSRMTLEEKKAYMWKLYDEKEKPQLLELIEYCQNNHKICPLPSDWNRICSDYMRYTHRCEFTKFPPFQLPLILSTWHYSAGVDKRLRLLTQIYWCYKNFGMKFMYSDIMKLKDTDWYRLNIGFPKVSIKDIKKEYARWLGVHSYDPKDPMNNIINIWKAYASWLGVHFYDPLNNSITNNIRYAKELDLSDMEAVDRFLLDTRAIYELNHREFSPLYENILILGIQKSVSESNDSLAETVILTLKDKTKDYPELLEYALSASKHNHQLKRVLYNLFREDIEEVRDFKV